jgi:phenylalanyl-tRNA synthetase beta chain
MNISLNWLKELVDINVTSKELANNFNLHSAEVARLEKLVDASKLVIGYVKTCVEHPSSDHLHICEVETGTDNLQIICGAPNVASGQKVIVALEGAVLPGDFKIKKAKIRGVESNGMICSLDELGIERKYHGEDGIHVLSDDAVVGDNPLSFMCLDDEVLELDITPNRSDLLSMMGVAYDVKAILDTKIHFDEFEVAETNHENPSQVFTETKGCKSYYARVVENVTIKESPTWLKSRLIAAGIRPINNVVDISNYVMLLFGQPLHTFDFKKITTKKIVVRDAFDKEKITTLDGKERILCDEDLVITDGLRAIALAGVMGGFDTEVTPATTTILIESATFDPIRVRKTSKRLDLRSEASIRFERGLDPARSKTACNAAASLLKELANGQISKGISFFDTHSYEKNRISISLKKIQDTTGYLYTNNEIESVLTRLSFKVSTSGNDFVVEVPSRRIDIISKQDLIEEIVRIHGYGNIPISYPITPTTGELTAKQKARRVIKNTLLSMGMDETITYTLVSKEKATSFDKIDKSLIALFNPMSEERAYLRHSLLPSLLDVLLYNLSRKVENIQLFELGKGYTYEEETEYISGVLTGDYQNSLWQGQKNPFDFYLLKGIMEALLGSVNCDNYEIKKPDTDILFLHPGISAVLKSDNHEIGYFGRLHPELEQKLNLPNTFVFELNLDLLLNASKRNIHMETIPKYPSVSRDIAIVVDKSTIASEIIETIKVAGKKSLVSVHIFDVYQGGIIESQKKSIAINLVFQDQQKTLSTEEVDQFVERILKQLNLKLGATLRA